MRGVRQIGTPIAILMPPKPGTLGSFVDEIKRGTYLRNAAARASRRKSPWNYILYLVFPVWVALFLLLLNLLQWASDAPLRALRVPDSWLWAHSIAIPLETFPLLLVTLVPAMVLVNWFIWYCVPPARRAMDVEDKPYPEARYDAAQPTLIRISKWTLPIGLILSIVGALCR